MKLSKIHIVGILWIIASVGIITYAFFKYSNILLYIGIFSLVVSSISTILISALSIFEQDKILDKELLQKRGLHIVECLECHKENVLEDKYCIHCGCALIQDNE